VNQKLVQDVFAKPFNDSNGTSYVNASFLLKEDLTYILMTAGLKAKTLNSKIHKDIFKTNIDVCDIEKSFWGKFVFNTFDDLLKNYSNFTLSCPLKRGFYHFTNLPMMKTTVSLEYLGSFVSAMNSSFIAQYTVRVKTESIKKPVRFITVIVNGKIHF
jgi:Protein of unknown function (DUF1091)